MGALADSVREVLELDAANIAPPPRVSAQGNDQCLQGIGNYDGRFILVLDMWMTPISGALRSWRVMRSTSSRRASSFFRSEMSRNTA